MQTFICIFLKYKNSKKLYNTKYILLFFCGIKLFSKNAKVLVLCKIIEG